MADEPTGGVTPETPEILETPDPTPDPTPEPTPAPEAPPVNWKDGLPETLKANERLSTFNSVEDLANAYINRPDSPKIPKSHTEYIVPQDSKLPLLAETAHKLGFTQEQLNGMIAYNNALTQQNEAATIAQQQTELKTLQTEWGDGWEGNISIAKRVISQFDEGGELSKLLHETRAGDNPIVIKFIHRIGKMLDEDGFLKSGEPSTKEQKSLAERIYPSMKT